MKVKEIKKLEIKDLENMMTEEEIDRMVDLGIDQVWKLLDLMTDGVDGLDDEEEFGTVSEYLDYWEDMHSWADDELPEMEN